MHEIFQYSLRKRNKNVSEFHLNIWYQIMAFKNGTLNGETEQLTQKTVFWTAVSFEIRDYKIWKNYQNQFQYLFYSAESYENSIFEIYDIKVVSKKRLVALSSLKTRFSKNKYLKFFKNCNNSFQYLIYLNKNYENFTFEIYDWKVVSKTRLVALSSLKTRFSKNIQSTK